MLKVCLLRGKYLNNFEGQNYVFNENSIKLTAVSSLFPLHDRFPFQVKRFLSPADLPFFPRIVKAVGNRIFGDSQLLIGLEKVRNDFDIFHTADPHYYFSYQMAKLKQKNLLRNLIVTSWETIPFNNESLIVKKKLKYFTMNQADQFLCYTLKAKRSLISEGIAEAKIRVIRLGVNLDRFKKKKNGAGERQKKTLTILFVGRLIEEKGVLDLYKSFTRLKAGSKKLKLRMIGEGDLKNNLNKRIRSDGLEADVKIENKNYEEMPQIYQDADLLVLPSRRTKTWEEQLGMVLLEAMGSGIPVVAYNSGSIPEIVGQAGMLLREGDGEMLTSSINRLITESDLRRKLGKMGKERAKKEFDCKKTAKKLENLYFEIAAKARY